MVARGAVVAEACRWIGTPYRHQASLAGIGCDCLGLVRGVWRGVVGEEPERVPAYTRDWAEAGSVEVLAEAGRRHLVEVGPAAARPGDVLVFRMRPGGPAKHAGILIEAMAWSRAGRPRAPRFVHAYEGAGVVPTRLTRWWAGRLAYAFRFPGVDD